ncbi:MAG: LapA family protein [Pseudomonadota bacterium]
MRYLKYLVLVAIALVLIVVSLANRGMVTLNTLPTGMAEMPGLGIFAHSIQLPLFLVVFLGIAIGVIIGYVWEWVREHQHRSAANKGQREARDLRREVKRLKGEKNEGKDEVLALLDDA